MGGATLLLLFSHSVEEEEDVRTHSGGKLPGWYDLLQKHWRNQADDEEVIMEVIASFVRHANDTEVLWARSPNV